MRIAAITIVATLFTTTAMAQQTVPADALAMRAIDLLWAADIPAFRRLVEAQPQVLNMRGPNGSTPFMYAAVYGDAEMLQALLAAGADPNRRNDANVSALMWAVDDLAMAQTLIDAGADINARSSDGLSTLAIAMSQPGSDAVVRLLLDRGAVKPTRLGPARSACSVTSTSELRAAQTLESAMQWREPVMQGIAPGDGPATVASILLALHAQKHKRDLTTDALVRYLKRSQQLDGRWIASSQQSICSGDIAQTALAARALQLYTPPQFQPAYEQSITTALRWLSHANPRNTDDRAYRLMGLVWTGASKYGVTPAKKALLSEQRDDGGWCDGNSGRSTARATELAIAALREAGVVAEEPAYKKAMQFLRVTPRAVASGAPEGL
jgi:hypothetical protein